MKPIQIKKSITADSRTCDYSKVTKSQLKESTLSHITDVRRCVKFFNQRLKSRALLHDSHKFETLDHFHKCFVGGFKDERWWNEHKKERHHFPDNDLKDINLIDVIEQIADSVSAGLARTGKVYTQNIDAELLKRAYINTVEMLIDNIEVVE